MKLLESLRPAKIKLSPTGVVSTVLVTVGLVLGATADMAWWILFALGAFGPSVLRAVGLLRDLDEFQRESVRRAAYHAYIAGGLFLSIVVIAKQWGTANLDHDQFSASSGVAVLVIVYFMSRLVSFWGARGAAFRVLLAFGCLWLAFVVLSHPGIEMFVEATVALPFFLLAFTSARFPRASGVALLLAGGFAFWFFDLAKAFRGNTGSLMVIVAFVIPLAAMGVALLATRPDELGAASGSHL